MATYIRARRLFIVGITILLAVLSFNVVAASETGGAVGGIFCRARKTINVGTYFWYAYVESIAVAPIGTIGYTWWTLREVCVPTGQITFQAQYSGSVRYGDDYFLDAANIYYRACSGQRKLMNMGTHDFKQGSDVWRPYLQEVKYK